MLKVANSVIDASRITGVLPVANGGTNASTASITSFNNITGFTASGTTGTTSTNLVFSSGPTFAGTAVFSVSLVGKAASDATVAGCELSATGAVLTRSAGDALLVNRETSDGTAVTLRRSNTTVGTIGVTTTLTTYNTTSDYRLKNITGALTGYKERLMSLKPKQGTWTADGSEFRGFIAHEFANSYPASVSGEKDAVDADNKPVMQSMQASSSEVMADLVALVLEQQALITQLTARVIALKTA